ncbi:hypothetical protein GP486_005796 [Trichoglossum hirsutum]|uniref:Uncharacterized protein n=1 Tax=Trichoglossum hirsutum TaxID=265104 RepID=A0A9P8L8I5_9PEZI|nr:hypothetical protein GP486_005796 [Trichoglossum hirsutum]
MFRSLNTLEFLNLSKLGWEISIDNSSAIRTRAHSVTDIIEHISDSSYISGSASRLKLGELRSKISPDSLSFTSGRSPVAHLSISGLITFSNIRVAKHARVLTPESAIEPSDDARSTANKSSTPEATAAIQSPPIDDNDAAKPSNLQPTTNTGADAPARRAHPVFSSEEECFSALDMTSQAPVPSGLSGRRPSTSSKTKHVCQVDGQMSQWSQNTATLIEKSSSDYATRQHSRRHCPLCSSSVDSEGSHSDDCYHDCDDGDEDDDMQDDGEEFSCFPPLLPDPTMLPTTMIYS